MPTFSKVHETRRSAIAEAMKYDRGRDPARITSTILKKAQGDKSFEPSRDRLLSDAAVKSRRAALMAGGVAILAAALKEVPSEIVGLGIKFEAKEQWVFFGILGLLSAYHVAHFWLDWLGQRVETMSLLVSLRENPTVEWQYRATKIKRWFEVYIPVVVGLAGTWMCLKLAVTYFGVG